MNMRKVISYIFWTPAGKFFFSDKELENCPIAEERACYHALHKFFALGFAPLLASMAYILVACELFPFVKHLVNDTQIMDWVMAGFAINAFFHLFGLMKHIKFYADRVLGNEGEHTQHYLQTENSPVQTEKKSLHGLTRHTQNLLTNCG